MKMAVKPTMLLAAVADVFFSISIFANAGYDEIHKTNMDMYIQLSHNSYEQKSRSTTD